MIVFALVAAFVSASPQLPQIDTTARLGGLARSALNGHPLEGVAVVVPDGQKSVITDSKGLFLLEGLPVGRQTIRISYNGRESPAYLFELRSRHTMQIAVVLDVEAEDLDPVVVEEQSPNTWRDLAGFYARMGEYRGYARFFTREDIARIRPVRLSSLLTLEGIRMRCGTGCVPTRFTRAGLCPIPIVVDGIGLHEDDYDRIAVSDVAAVEVYRGLPPNGLNPGLAITPGSPIWVSGGRSSETTGSCGMVLIWTR